MSLRLAFPFSIARARREPRQQGDGNEGGTP